MAVQGVYAGAGTLTRFPRPTIVRSVDMNVAEVVACVVSCRFATYHTRQPHVADIARHRALFAVMFGHQIGY